MIGKDRGVIGGTEERPAVLPCGRRNLLDTLLVWGLLVIYFQKPFELRSRVCVGGAEEVANDVLEFDEISSEL